MKYFLFIAGISISVLLSAQDHCTIVDKAYQAETIYKSKKNLPDAIKLYKEVFESSIRDVSVVLDAIDCATNNNDTLNTVHFLEYGIKCGLTIRDYKRLWKHLGNNQSLEYFMLEVDTLLAINKYEKTLDQELIKRLQFLAERDQEYRSDDNEDDRKMKINDSLNWLSLKEIVQSRGALPGYSQLGIDGFENLEILFIHMDKEPLQFFLPYVIEAIKSNECYFGEVVLYQLERIGMNDGVIYTITDDLEIVEHAKRTKINAEFVCQSFGEWFLEKNHKDKKLYFTPIDPTLEREEVNRVRKLLCLDTIESKWAREPWVNVVSLSEFRDLFSH